MTLLRNAGLALTLATLGALPLGAQAQAALFNFDADTDSAYYDATPFTDTDNGLSATFSRFTTFQGGAGGFAVTPASSLGIGTSEGLGGNVLDGLTDGGIPDTLAVQFSRPLTDVSLDFAGIIGYTDYGTPPSGDFPQEMFFSEAPQITLSAFSGGPGGTLVGTSQATGALQADGLYEDPLSFGGGTPFTTITVAETDPLGRTNVNPANFYLDNFSATPAQAAVPEPSPLALLALGALPLGLTAVKRRRSA